MTLQLCKRIGQLRKEQNATQAKLAEYLGISPQAVSKWELEAAMPDVYLIPKIAFFFGVTTDYLFGVCDLDSTQDLVYKYSCNRNDRNYKEAYDALSAFLEIDEKNDKALAYMSHLYYQRAMEYVEKSNGSCEHIIAMKSDSEWVQPAHMQMIRNNTILGKVDHVNVYMAQFESSHTITDFLYLITALNETRQFEESLRWGSDWLNRFTENEQEQVLETLLDAACSIKDLNEALKYYDLLNVSNLSIENKYFGRYKLWGLYKRLEMANEGNALKEQLKKDLDIIELNSYWREYYSNQLNML